MEPKRLETPRIKGERRRILESVMESASSSEPKPLKRSPLIAGIRSQAAAETAKIRRAKKENMLSMNSFRFSLFSIIKGTKTETETTEATVTKMKSGTRNAA